MRKRKRFKRSIRFIISVFIVSVLVFFVVSILSLITDLKAMSSDPLQGYQILLDPGHGGRDPGTKNGDLYEKSIVLDFSHIVKETLKEAGAEVVMTRTGDEYISLEERREKSVSIMPDVFISFHINSFEDPSIHGIQTYYYDQEDDFQFAKQIHPALVEVSKMKDRGITQEDYAVLKENPVPAVLLELGFMSNLEDLKQMQKKQFQQAIADQLVQSLTNYFKNS